MKRRKFCAADLVSWREYAELVLSGAPFAKIQKLAKVAAKTLPYPPDVYRLMCEDPVYKRESPYGMMISLGAIVSNEDTKARLVEAAGLVIVDLYRRQKRLYPAAFDGDDDE